MTDAFNKLAKVGDINFKTWRICDIIVNSRSQKSMDITPIDHEWLLEIRCKNLIVSFSDYMFWFFNIWKKNQLQFARDVRKCEKLHQCDVERIWWRSRHIIASKTQSSKRWLKHGCSFISIETVNQSQQQLLLDTQPSRLTDSRRASKYNIEFGAVIAFGCAGPHN